MTATSPAPRSMRPKFSPMRLRSLLTVAALTIAWCGLWQDVSVANLMSGALLSVGVLSLGVGTKGRGSIRLAPLMRLLLAVFIDLCTSTVDVAKEILTPTDYTNEAIIAVGIPAESRHHFLLLIVAVTLTPGTAVVDADPDTGTLYLHLLHYERAAEVRAHVSELAVLAEQALPTQGQRP